VTKTNIMRAVRGRPALVVWSFIVPALMLPACAEHTSNSDTKTPIVVTERGVEIVEMERDEARRTVAATVVEHGLEARITIVSLTDGPSPGLVATIESDDKSFFELSIAMDETSGELWLRERTAEDVLTLTRREANGRVYESYEINGDELSLSYPSIGQAGLDKAVAQYRAGKLDAYSSPEIREIGDVLAKFDAFYTPTLSNTLHDNAVGELLMSLLNDPTMSDLVTGGEITPNRVDGLGNRFCLAASRCAAIKCPFGGSANVVCAACTGATMACIIMEIFCWFAGCNCCF
jgi:hypothetical protein